MYATRSIEVSLVTAMTYQSNGYAAQPKSMPSGVKSMPALQISKPSTSSAASNSTLSRLTSGEMKEMTWKVSAITGKVAICAAGVTASISAMVCPAGRRLMGASGRMKKGVNCTMQRAEKRQLKADIPEDKGIGGAHQQGGKGQRRVDIVYAPDTGSQHQQHPHNARAHGSWTQTVQSDIKSDAGDDDAGSQPAPPLPLAPLRGQEYLLLLFPLSRYFI